MNFEALPPTAALAGPAGNWGYIIPATRPGAFPERLPHTPLTGRRPPGQAGGAPIDAANRAGKGPDMGRECHRTNPGDHTAETKPQPGARETYESKPPSAGQLPTPLPCRAAAIQSRGHDIIVGVSSVQQGRPDTEDAGAAAHSLRIHAAPTSSSASSSSSNEFRLVPASPCPWRACLVGGAPASPRPVLLIMSAPARSAAALVSQPRTHPAASKGSAGSRWRGTLLHVVVATALRMSARIVRGRRHTRPRTPAERQRRSTPCPSWEAAA